MAHVLRVGGSTHACCCAPSAPARSSVVRSGDSASAAARGGRVRGADVRRGGPVSAFPRGLPAVSLSFNASLNACGGELAISRARGPHQQAIDGRRGPGRGGVVQVRAQEVRTEQKVKVTLGPYKDGAIAATVAKPHVAAEEVDKTLKAKLSQTHVFERINFTGSGAKIGHTVKINFEGKYAEGPQAGQLVKGTKAAGFELELKERDDEPWKTFVKEITKAGMGQEESKSFELTFPTDYKAKPLAGVRARFTVTVKEIGVKKELPKDPRPESEIRAEIEQQLLAAEERKANEVVDTQIRTALLASSEADVEKVAASVTWAKFGEKSLQDFKWNVLQEEVGRVEGIPFDQVMPFLRSQANITYT